MQHNKSLQQTVKQSKIVNTGGWLVLRQLGLLAKAVEKGIQMKVIYT